MLINWFRMNDDANRVWFTADHHFGHARIINYCQRPFADVEQMDAVLIEKWNGRVGPDDIVFHLGDFTLGDMEMADRYFAQLQGRIFVLANEWHHDCRWLDTIPGGHQPPRFARAPRGLMVSSSGHAVQLLPPLVVLEVPWAEGSKHPIAITLCHYPLAEWDRKHYGAWHLHGHSHGKHQHNAKPGEQAFILDVGVDAMGYGPICLGGVLDNMYSLGWA